MAVVEADDHHAEVQEIGDDREQRRFLPTMLRGARGECPADLPVQRSAHPKAPCLVQEIGHLRRQSSEPGARANDDCVVSGKVVDLRD